MLGKIMSRDRYLSVPGFRLRNVWLAAAALGLALHGAAPALAQNAPAGAAAAQPDAAKPKAEPARIPAAVLSGLLTGTPESLLTLRQYLASVGGNPDEVARYALSVVQQLKDSNLVRDPALIIAAAERVSAAVKDTLSGIKITQLKIDRNFRPPAGVLALDFAPADAKVRPGFKKVLTNDAILGGTQMQAIRRPGDDSDLLADGITGVENISVPMPDGEYRVTLMTENIGDAATSLSPFGEKIMANGEALNVSQAGPDAWLKQSVLSNQGLNGFNSATSRQGGAVTITVKVTGGKLNLGFNMGSDALKTYLTGMVVEPANRPSVMTAVPEVRDALFTPPETQARYESQIASSIADLLERESPSAGQAADDLAKPVQTVQKVSPN
jgi:hypothetical protein